MKSVDFDMTCICVPGEGTDRSWLVGEVWETSFRPVLSPGLLHPGKLQGSLTLKMCLPFLSRC